MINYLVGKPLIWDNSLTILINGVGYQVLVSPTHLSQIQGQTEVELFIYTHVKEDKLELYGFRDIKDKTVFCMLLNVSGVGPKTALLMFDLGAESVAKAVQDADLTFFKAIPRVGKKLAQKIIIELKPKLGDLKELNLQPLSREEEELTQALLGLGFEESLVSQVVAEIEVAAVGIETALKTAIKELTKNRQL